MRLVACTAPLLVLCVACTAQPQMMPDASVKVDMTRIFDFAGAPDLVSGDMTGAQPDLRPGDMAAATVDMAMPDLALPDLVVVADLVAVPDLATVMDLVVVPDLRPVDLANADLTCNLMCNTPPAAKCEGNVIRTYQNGTCVAGTCSYPSTTMTCANGCYNAQCVGQELSFLGNSAGFESTSGKSVNIQGGTASANDTVSIITQTYPKGTVKDLNVYVSIGNNQFINPTIIKMIFDKEVGNNDQWYAIIPKQPSGTKVYFYLKADKYTSGSIYDPSQFGVHLSYTSQ